MPLHLPCRRARPAPHPAAVVLALVLPWSAAAFAQDTDPSPVRTPPSHLGTDGEGRRSTPGPAMHHRAGSGSIDLSAAVMRSVERLGSLPFSGNVDHDFARVMQAQQRHAIEMARVQLQHGKDPQLRELAEQIVASHEAQLERLDRWLRTHPQPSAPGTQPPRR